MLSAHRKELFRQLKVRLAADGSFFSPVKPQKGDRKDCLLFDRVVNNRFKHFLLVVTDNSENKFGLDVAGALDGQFPWEHGLCGDAMAWGSPEVPVYGPKKSAPYDIYRFQLGMLCTPPKERWWNTSSTNPPMPGDSQKFKEYIFAPADEEPDLVEESLDAVLAIIKEKVVPYVIAVDCAGESFGFREAIDF